MKSLSLWLSAFAGLAASAAIPEPQAGHAGHNMPGAPAPAAHADPPAGHSAPKAAAPVAKLEEIKSQFSPKNKRVRVTYGTYHLKAFNAPSAHGDMVMEGMEGMAHEGGMLDATTAKAMKPCSDCTLKYAKSYLHYPDGSVANIDTGAWLHHLTLSVVGPGREDLACPGGTKRIPKNWERMLAFHNDRNETFYGVTATDEMGFYLKETDDFQLELMFKNELNTPKDVVFSIEWEFVPGKPAGWSEVRGLWVDVAPCAALMSDVNPPKGKTKFVLDGPEWTSTVDGRLLNTIGHMHDGGLDVKILQNGKPVCTSSARYDEPGFVPGAKALADGAAKMSHISSYSPCVAIGALKKGDKIGITASYDFEKYKPGLNKLGDESHVMGLAMVFVEVKSK